MYTPEQETKIRRAAQQDRIGGAEALFRNRQKPAVDVGAAVKRAVTGAVRSIDWSNSRLHPDQFPSASRDKPLTSRIQQAQRRKGSEVVRRQTVRVPSGKKPASTRFPL